jgi:Rap1a immunity proteins
MENNDPAPSDYPRLMGAAVCTAYVMGLGDGIVTESSYAGASLGGKVKTPYCEADTYGMEQGQRVRVLLKYIRNHPEKAHLPTAILYISAMGDAFPPCPERK